jgi:hypothetical protein
MFILYPLLGSLDKTGGRKMASMFHFCLIKDGTVFPLFSLNNPALVSSQKNTTPLIYILIYTVSFLSTVPLLTFTYLQIILFFSQGNF